MICRSPDLCGTQVTSHAHCDFGSGGEGVGENVAITSNI